MKHDNEKTAEFGRNNIIHVNFFGPKRAPSREEALLRTDAAIAPVAKFNRRRGTWAVGAPWVLRLLALAGILILSLLVL